MIHEALIEAAKLLAEGALGPIPSEEDGLTELLYGWYLNATPLPAATGPLLPHELEMPPVLRNAHHDATRFEGGWRAETVSTHGRVVARKGELVRVLDRSDYTVPARLGLRAQPRDALLVSRCWDWIDEETGFWHLRRGEWPPPGADRLIRLYWNCAPVEAARVVGAISAVFSANPGVSYILKTPSVHGHNGRSDALVLYLGPGGFTTCEHELRAAASALVASLRQATPRMTLRVGRGLAFAEGNLEGGSFGDSRCRLIATAYASAGAEERRDAPRLAEIVADAFSDAGLDPVRPYLEAGKP